MDYKEKPFMSMDLADSGFYCSQSNSFSLLSTLAIVTRLCSSKTPSWKLSSSFSFLSFFLPQNAPLFLPQLVQDQLLRFIQHQHPSLILFCIYVLSILFRQFLSQEQGDSSRSVSYIASYQSHSGISSLTDKATPLCPTKITQNSQDASRG